MPLFGRACAHDHSQHPPKRTARRTPQLTGREGEPGRAVLNAGSFPTPIPAKPGEVLSRFGIPRRRSTFRTRSHDRLTKPGGPFRQRPWVRDPCPPTMPRLARRPPALASRARREVVNTRPRRGVAGAARHTPPGAPPRSTCHGQEDRASSLFFSWTTGRRAARGPQRHHPLNTPTRQPSMPAPYRALRATSTRGARLSAGATEVPIVATFRTVVWCARSVRVGAAQKR